MKIAALDLGTNTALLLIAEWDGKSLTVLHDEARITRLGQQLAHTKQFHPDAIERLLSVLKDYQKTCTHFGVSGIICVGTAGFRKAKNAPDVVQRVKKETGFDVKIISGDDEAKLSYLSAFHDFGATNPNLYALDIGGGSSELISDQGGVSFDVGAVILTEAHVKNDPVTELEYEALKNEIDRVFSSQPLSLQKPCVLVGLAGSVTTLSAIKQGLTVWDGSKVQGSTLTLDEVRGMVEQFRRQSVAEKKKIPGMVAGREDTILAGTLILQKAMEKIGVTEVTVSDRGLRYGALLGSLNL